LEVYSEFVEQFGIDLLWLFTPIFLQKPQRLFHADIARDRADTQALTWIGAGGINKLRNFAAIAVAGHNGLLDLLWSWDAENDTQIRRAIRFLFRRPLFGFQE
jgi:hypothetical protein